MVAVDFEDRIDELLEFTADLARTCNAKAWIVHVAAPHPAYVGMDVGPQYLRDIQAEELRDEHRAIQTFAKRFEAADIPAEGLLIQGPTVESLLEEADKLDVDLVIIGNHSHGILYKALLGSTTESLIHQADIPVLVYPMQADD